MTLAPDCDVCGDRAMIVYPTGARRCPEHIIKLGSLEQEVSRGWDHFDDERYVGEAS